jgi:hypothetical protein
MNTIFMFSGGRCQFGAPGGARGPYSPGRFCDWWQLLQFIPTAPWPSRPRCTFIACGRP